MISVEQATARIVAAFSPLECETVPLKKAAGRVLASDIIASVEQPPFAVSAMDGYAVLAADVAHAPVTLKVIGGAPAGHPFEGHLAPGEAVRLFTGGVVPEGADTVVIQENTDCGTSDVTVNAGSAPGRHIRQPGLDFRKGDVLAGAGRRLTARHLALLAAADIARVDVRRRPRILLAATGDELSAPGEPRKPGGIVASSLYSLEVLIARWGGQTINLGIVPDRIESVAQIADRASEVDLVVTLGGASVGDHDLVQRALAPKGFTLDFWKIAMRPGKPLIFGRLGATPLLGLPGNPVSSYVCALLFLKPATAAMLGSADEQPFTTARLVSELAANDGRQDFLRARLSRRDGELWVEPMPVQDSSMQKVLAEADCLVVRAPHAPAATAGDTVTVLPLE
ncbi:MAG TPA: gephyrin-like molybdotransferase Glp [Rhizomicrobium sp.]|nr:gephyrin-like molybdotransferase Glp [Rhizomicrobium sp.]